MLELGHHVLVSLRAVDPRLEPQHIGRRGLDGAGIDVAALQLLEPPGRRVVLRSQFLKCHLSRRLF
jgi:hypothetical protein